MTTKERIKKFIDTLDYGRSKFEETAGICIGTLSSKSPSISSEYLERIASAYPELSMEWLIRGKEPMILSSSSRDSPHQDMVPAEDFHELARTIQILTTHYKNLLEENENLKKSLQKLKSA